MKRCSACKEERIESEFSKPLEVDWLCIKCHRKLHQSD